jgi:hypothetical protein
MGVKPLMTDWLRMPYPIDVIPFHGTRIHWVLPRAQLHAMVR